MKGQETPTISPRHNQEPISSPPPELTFFRYMSSVGQGGQPLSEYFQDKMTYELLALSKHQEVNYDLDKVEEILISKSPFIYLDTEERDLIRHTSKFINVIGSERVIVANKTPGEYNMMVILEGKVYAVDKKSNYCEILTVGDSFGADACLFGETQYSIITASIITTLMQIKKNIFFSLLKPEKQYTLMLGRNLLHKQKIFSALENFVSFTAERASKGEINISELLPVYSKISSSLHPYLKSKDLDISAWKYAIERLPENLTSTFVYHLVTEIPEIIKTDDRVAKVSTKSRMRTIFNTLTGKNMLVLRDMESDLNDLLSNMCIHCIEAKKLRNKLRLPTFLTEMNLSGSLDKLPLLTREIKGLEEIWKEKTLENIKNIILHHEDYKIVVISSAANLKAAPSEKWTEEMWKGCQKALGKNISISEAIINGLVVDVLQGSTRTLGNILSPYLLKNQKTILNWFENSGITFKTTDFLSENDKLYAASFYYFKEFPEKSEEKRVSDEEAGIYNIDNTQMTGVKIMIINVYKLKYPGFIPKGKMHLIINIGYTFGKQGYDIIKCFSLLFSSCIGSFSFIGKAGGLVGNRKDILVGAKFHNIWSKGITLANPIDINTSYFTNLGLTVHQGPMLTVGGTILQNKNLLNYYKHIEGCIGLEMEGCYFAEAIKQSIEMSLLKEAIPARFLYYISDLPLNPDTNLAQEDGNVSWDEGIPTMNAITEYCLKLCSGTFSVQVKDRIVKFVEKHENVALIQNEWNLAQILLNNGIAVVCFVSSHDDLPKLTGDYVSIDYDEDYEYFLKIQAIVKIRKTFTIVVLNDPIDNEFWVPYKMNINNKPCYPTVKVQKNYKMFLNSCVSLAVIISEKSQIKQLQKMSQLKLMKKMSLVLLRNGEVLEGINLAHNRQIGYDNIYLHLSKKVILE